MRPKLLWLFSVLPLVITAVSLRFLPDQLPAHYDLAGEIDRWGSKYEKLLFPIIILLVSAGWQLMIGYYNQKSKRSKDEKVIREARSNVRILYLVAILSALLFGIMHAGSLYSAYREASLGLKHAAFDSLTLLNLLIGIMLIIIGVVLPNTGRNKEAAPRPARDTARDAVWRDQNRVVGLALVVAGLCTVVVALLVKGAVATAVMLGLLLAAVLVTFAFAHRN